MFHSKVTSGPTYKMRRILCQKRIVLVWFFLHLSLSFDKEMLSGLLAVEYSALPSEMNPPE